MLVSLYNGNVHIWSHESQVGVAGGAWSQTHILMAV